MFGNNSEEKEKEQTEGSSQTKVVWKFPQGVGGDPGAPNPGQIGLKVKSSAIKILYSPTFPKSTYPQIYRDI